MSTKQVRARGGVLLGVILSGGFVAGALGDSPAANATCFSAFGLGKGGGCTSNLTSFALAIGKGATADAGTGLLSGAISLGTSATSAAKFSILSVAVAAGNNANASNVASLLSLAQQIGAGSAATVGALDFAAGVSTGGAAPQATGAAGLGNLSVQFGPGQVTNLGILNFALGAASGGDGTKATNVGGFGNWALNVGNAGTSSAQGYLSSSANILGASTVHSDGILAAAWNILGDGNDVSSVQGPFPNTTASLAFVVNGDGDTVTAGPGPLAIAGAISQTSQTITRSAPGINVSGLTAARSASVVANRKASPSTATHSSDSELISQTSTGGGAIVSASAAQAGDSNRDGAQSTSSVTSKHAGSSTAGKRNTSINHD